MSRLHGLDRACVGNELDCGQREWLAGADRAVDLEDGAIFQHGGIDIGLAVAIEDGLVVPVLRGADTLTLAEIAARREDLVARAQAGKLRPADIQGGGFTISNLGM